MNPRLQIGDQVRIRADYPKGHIRTPFYIRGKTGRVADIIGAFGNPESLSVFGDGLPKQVLYRIRFNQRETWGDYSGPPADSIDIEIYEHWLEAPEKESSHAA